jgi:hypothetical protein
MTSRHPEPAPAGTTGQAGTPPPGTTGQAGTPAPGSKGAEPRPPYAGALLLRLVLLVLLIVLGLAGLRGVVTEPRWNGPLHRDGAVVGLVLEAVLLVLLVITVRRQSAYRRSQVPGMPGDAAAKLRGVLIFVLGTGMATVAVVILAGLHLHLFSGKGLKPRPPQAQPTPTFSFGPPHKVDAGWNFHISAAAVLYTLLIVLLLAGVVLSIWWARRLRPSIAARPDDFIAEDSLDLREAVEAGRSALRTFDDARAAIIACYVAMEAALAERGTARAVADTPDELLSRARATGLIRGTAAGRLTALFYEARFSSHPLDQGQRAAAERALDELADALAQTEAETAGAGTDG